MRIILYIRNFFTYKIKQSFKMSTYSDWENNPAIQRFREYLRIPSVHPDINYDDCITFLKKQAEQLELPYKVYTHVADFPIIIITWEGTDPSLPSILLNSHMDVVAVFPENWKHPPFSAHLAEDGTIYARGAQDMKSVGMQYLEAVRKLKASGIRLKRTLHISFVPEEEKGGKQGMQDFVATDDFRALNIGLSLDEGGPGSGENFMVFNAERSLWHLALTCPGESGHGSLLLPNTAGEKVRIIIDRFMDYRAAQKQRLKDNPSYIISNVTTVNLTKLSGGVQANVVPETLTVMFDIRLAVDVDHTEFENMIKGWCAEAGDGITFEYEQKEPRNGVTVLDDSNPFWVAFKKAADDLNIKLINLILPGGSDSRFIRRLGIPAIGFSPMNHTPLLVHSDNEHIHADIFLKGIDIYEKIIPAVSNV